MRARTPSTTGGRVGDFVQSPRRRSPVTVVVLSSSVNRRPLVTAPIIPYPLARQRSLTVAGGVRRDTTTHATTTTAPRRPRPHRRRTGARRRRPATAAHRHGGRAGDDAGRPYRQTGATVAGADSSLGHDPRRQRGHDAVHVRARRPGPRRAPAVASTVAGADRPGDGRRGRRRRPARDGRDPTTGAPGDVRRLAVLHFARDAAPGDVNGQGRGDNWYVSAPWRRRSA